ncbi:XrtA-associated tyrosine autokinase [Sapientia aquatica]|uniref:non-specific protein-tyrosine kinase n=1 Tax=Sapientia aquatica TaxID=1549640 RepID=A0A4R5W124_9BURK|nr:XrtA-associated tyrosine autokinase [Sapientia aquatica]TDK65683.1 tyrosine-protein kinase family protein [Sapientia aquatica]
MSIIEKAISKLDQNKNSATEVHAAPASTIAHPSAPPATPVTPIESPRAPIEAVKAQPSARQLEQPHSKKVEIDLEQLVKLGMVSPHTDRSNISEEFRRIKRPLLDKIFKDNNNDAKHKNLIMVTSSLPGEGKTFCAVNLAISIALELDHTVLLVDADVAKPSVGRYLKTTNELEENKAGLMDILLDKNLDLSDVMLRTNIDKLTLLRSGRNHKHATELLASHAMSTLLDEIATRYPDRVIIFDSPPLLLSTEARALASKMGQIALVVEAGSTTQNAVKDLLSQLKTNNNVSLIYNKAQPHEGTGFYGDYYG